MKLDSKSDQLLKEGAKLNTENQIMQQQRLARENKDMFELPPLKLRSFANLRLSYVYREDLLMQSCIGKRVLHMGCSSAPYTQQRLEAGTHLHQRLLGITKELYGIDLSRDGLDIMQRHLGCGNLYVGDAEKLDEVRLEKNDFDVILAGDILEHLNNPGLFLSGVTRFMSPHTKLIISTNNAFSLPNFVRIAIHGFREGTGHVIVSSPATLTNLLDRYGLIIRKMATGYQQQPKGLVKTVFFNLGKAFFKLFPTLGGTLIVFAALAQKNE